MRRHPEPDDPLVREIASLWRAIRRILTFVIVLFLLLAAGVAGTFVLRAIDQDEQRRETNAASVRECFRNSASRPALHDISLDETLSLSVRGFIRQLYENTPRRTDCFQLAEQLGVSPDPPPVETAVK